MSEPKLISPLLDNYIVGDSISEKPGVRCCPALERNIQTKCIVKIISTPASQAQLDALLLTGAYADAQSALQYFQSVADGIVDEANILKRLSQLEGFFPYLNWQIAPMNDGVGFDVYAISEYRKTLSKLLKENNLTHLAAVNLGLDLCTALAVCRRIGYLYVNLKPENIYLADNNTWKIGDIGFVSLDSLKYASLPERYRSDYTAPEIADAFASLNTTLDVYALGLVLYRIYNGNQLPANFGNPNNEPLLPPDYADYEMSEIILKACDPNPENRWQDPIEMGQALVTYMQRNAVNDTPIIPPVVVSEPSVDLTEEVADTPEGEAVAPEVDTPESAPAEDAHDDPPTAGVTPEDDLSEILTPSEDETSPEQNEDQLGGIAVTDEVSDILSLADDLVAHPVPEMPPAADWESSDTAEETALQPTNEENENTTGNTATITEPTPVDEVPEAIESEEAPEQPAEAIAENDSIYEDESDVDVSEKQPDDEPAESSENTVLPPPESADIPENEIEQPEIIEQETAETEENNEEDSEDSVEDAEDNEAEETEDGENEENSTAEPADDSFEDNSPPRKSHWLRNLLIAAIVALLAVSAYFFYTKYYHQTIDQLEIVTSIDGDATIRITTKADESKLTVICEDADHNPKSAPVKNGIAVFEDLAPGAAYTVRVEISGIHKLTGKTTSAFTTPDQIEFLAFEALTGDEDGSILLRFETRNQASERWCITYDADDGTQETVTFSENEYTVRNLTVGKEYTFHLAPESEIKYTGITETKYTASAVVVPENVRITSVLDGTLTASWNAPADTEVSKWIVRCYNDDGFSKTIETAENTVSIDGIDTASACTVEVSAEGMSQTACATIPANVITVTDFTIVERGTKLVLNWNHNSTEAATAWLITYSVDNSLVQELACDSNENVELSNPIPGSVYTIRLKTADGSEVLGGELTFKTAKAKKFSGYTVTSSHMRFKLCRTPNKSNWSEKDLKASDYTSTFKVGEKASFLIGLTKSYNVATDKIATMIVFRDSEKSVVLTSVSERTWRQMWFEGNCELDIPELPGTPGQYTVSVFMNGMLAGESKITIA